MKPFFSIVIPVYNVAPYLGECLDSLLAQTCSDWEAICVDDGSSDGSETILDTYAEKDSRIRVFHQKNGGVSSARNHGLEMVQGEWLGFLDSDDMFHPQTLDLAKQEIVTNEGIEVVSFGLSRASDSMILTFPEPVIRQRDFRAQIEESYFREAFCSRFYRWSVVSDVRFRPYIMAEDTLYSTVVGVRFSKGSVIENPLYFYRPREGSAMLSAPSMKKVKDAFEAKIETLQILLAHAARISRKFLCGECKMMSEAFAYRLSITPNVQDFRLYRREVFKKFSKHPALPLWFRITFLLVGSSRTVFAERILMEFPFRLKLLRNRVLRMVKGAH